MESAGQIGRKKKTPEELAAEARGEGGDSGNGGKHQNKEQKLHS